MRKITEDLFNKVKMSLVLSEVSEVMKIHGLSNSEISYVKRSEGYQDYCRNFNKMLEDREKESEMARAQFVVSQSKNDQILKELGEIRQMLERLELSK